MISLVATALCEYFHRRTMHCTVAKRYEIGRDFHDGCIELRVVPVAPWGEKHRGA